MSSLKKLIFLPIAITLTACGIEKSNLDETIQSQTFIGTSRQDLVACLGEPATQKQLKNKQYLAYGGKNNCQATFTVKNNTITEVLYTAVNGKQLNPGQCLLVDSNQCLKNPRSQLAKSSNSKLWHELPS